MSKPNEPLRPTLPRLPASAATAGPNVPRAVPATAPHGAAPAGTPSPTTQRGLGLFSVRPEPLDPAAARTSPPPAGLPSARTIEVVRSSWAKVMPISDAAAALFYERLFEMDPTVRPLFKTDITEQKKKLMQTLGVAVDGLGNLDKLIPVLQALGVRHRGYMVGDHHYETVGAALIWTLREGLGDDFTSETEAAWKQVYGVIANVMKEAANAGASTQAAAPGRAAQPKPKPAETARPAPAPAPAKPAPAAVSTAHAVDASRTLVGVKAPWATEPDAKSPLDARTIELVQQSWAQVMPISDAAAALFYGRLFEMDPSVRPLFKSDITEQKRKLMQTLGVAVDGLSNLSKLVPVLQALGARHRGYMVRVHHYDLVGGALLWTLHEGLGDKFTPEVEAAWKKVYGLVADVMKGAAGEERRPESPPLQSPQPQRKSVVDAAMFSALPGAQATAPSPPAQQATAPTAKAGFDPGVFEGSGDFEEDDPTLHHVERPDINDTVPGEARISDPHLAAAGERPSALEVARAAAMNHGDPHAKPSNIRPPTASGHEITAPRIVAAPPMELSSLRGILIPSNGQEILLNVHVKLDPPAAAPAPEPRPAEPAPSGGAMVGLLVALLCIASSLGTAMVLGSGSVEKIDRAILFTTLGAPLVLFVLVLGAFALGYMLGRRASRGREGGTRG